MEGVTGAILFEREESLSPLGNSNPIDPAGSIACLLHGRKARSPGH